MSTLKVDRLPYTPIRDRLIYYYPKVMKAIGTERQLFPNQQISGIRDAKLDKDLYTKTEREWTTTHGDISGMTSDEKQWSPEVRAAQVRWVSRNNPNIHAQIGRVVDDLLNPKKPQVRRFYDAQYLLMGYCNWLDRVKYTYNQSENPTNFLEEMGERKAKKLGHVIPIMGASHEKRADFIEEYNLFAIVKSPIGNCLNAARAFALLLFLNGFRKESLSLCCIQAAKANVDAIVFKGEKNPKLEFLVPTRKGVVTSVFELTNTRGGTISGRQCPPQDVDQPFKNHWIVQCAGNFYDPLYRCSYNSPEDAFDVVELLEVGQPQSPAPAVCNWEFTNLYRDREGQQRYFFEFTSRRICEALQMKRPEAKKFVLHKTKAGEGSVLMDGSPIPLGLGRVFGWCVPADEAAMRNVLMAAVTEYERGLNFFRRPSEDSIDFCKKSRAFCEKTDNVPRAIYDPARETGWKNYKVWTEQSARETIYNAMYLPRSVGETLKKCLCKAFEVPSYFRA
jgi:hypothetical protein